jgi:hypothetical protein
MMRQTWIDKKDSIAVSRQCVLAGVSRATLHAQKKPKVADKDDELLKRLIDEEYTRHPFYGTRRMVVYLGRCGHIVNREAGTAFDAHHRPARHGTRPQHQQGTPAAQGISIPAAWHGH